MLSIQNTTQMSPRNLLTSKLIRQFRSGQRLNPKLRPFPPTMYGTSQFLTLSPRLPQKGSRCIHLIKTLLTPPLMGLPLIKLLPIKLPLIMLPFIILPHNVSPLPIVLYPLHYPLNLVLLLHLNSLSLINLMLIHLPINQRNQRHLNRDFLSQNTKQKRSLSMGTATIKHVTTDYVQRLKSCYQMESRSMTLTL